MFITYYLIIVISHNNEWVNVEKQKLWQLSLILSILDWYDWKSCSWVSTTFLVLKIATMKSTTLLPAFFVHLLLIVVCYAQNGYNFDSGPRNNDTIGKYGKQNIEKMKFDVLFQIKIHKKIFKYKKCLRKYIF